MHDIPLRPRSPSEIVDAAFQLYRRNAGPILLMSAVAYAPAIIVQLLILGTAPTAQGVPALAGSLAVVGGLISWLGYALMSGAVCRLAADVYLGKPADVGGSVRATLPRVPALMGAAVLKTLAMAAPVALVGVFFALVIPATARGGAGGAGITVLLGVLFFFAAMVAALYLFATYFAVTPLVVIEGEGPTGSMSRSSKLSEGRRLPILGTVALVFAIYLVLMLAVMTIAALLGGFTSVQTVGQVLAMHAFTIIAYPLYAVTEMLLYYDARIRREAFDVEVMAAALGSTPAPAATAR